MLEQPEEFNKLVDVWLLHYLAIDCGLTEEQGLAEDFVIVLWPLKGRPQIFIASKKVI